jgi:uncharacterized YigZ family protein
MQMKDEYRTLQGLSQGLYKEKGSRFIGIALPVQSIDEVRLQLDKLRKEYHDARHHCYAYRIGEEPYESRFQDDGEPSGTAGKPIFGQIQSFDLTNVLIVVIRYFGGIKLGTGGLIQAYRAAAKDAVENGTVITKIWTAHLEIRFDYMQMNDVMRVIKDENLKIIRQDASVQCCILLEIRKGSYESIINKFSTFEKLEMTVI